MLASELFSLPDSLQAFAPFFAPQVAPWDWLARIDEALASCEEDLSPGPEIPPGVHITGRVYLHPTVKLPPYCVIEGPAWIGPETELRPGALIRGRVIVGKGAVLGNASEFKNCLLLDRVQAAHFNYVGDSILGNRAHLGAGAICANLRLDQQCVSVITPEGRVKTGLRKLGAILGDDAEAGCNAVLQPGTILGKGAAIGPTIAFGGYLKEGSMAFFKPEIRRLPR